MAPPRAPLAQSESKARFFERLGMDEQNEHHRRLYAMMKEEAVEGRRRMTLTPESLAPQFRDDPSIEPPYSSAQISETAIHREILRIYQYARRETRPVYDLGRDTEGIEEENWVIRWMLWHVFRYRDNRNKNRRALSPADGGESGSGNNSADGAGGAPSASRSSTNTITPSRYWDPVRDG
ncbi:hypothetical protein LTR37_000787 [Vermiconidia calcicola]|uniref:Uncharacterized protein n=1 Tax=Vermiconidia calcicola TaxID=1690605 RepID=A0ACC3NZS1_9PEZI|nr:hypothetical protein LTR37_000787 [Vermiconidia calcicola]